MDLFTPAELIGVIDTVIPETNFWLSTFFREEVQFNTEEIAFDKISHSRTLAPFVAPNVQGRPMVKRGFNTQSFKPAYIKPKDAITPSQMFTRRAGEALGSGSMTPEERWDASVAATMAEHRRAIERRLEWMGAQAALNGAVTVEGEDYPSVTVSFGRDADNTVTLTGAALWSASTADIVGDLETWSQKIFDKTGYVVSDVYVSPDVWAVMRKDAAVIALMETRRGSVSQAELGPTAASQKKYMGHIGEFAIWTYSDTYVDDAGTSAKFMADGTVFMGAADGMKGIQAFGAILDVGAKLQPMRMFPKMWNEEDPSRTFAMTQSAPLMIPREPNATLKASVL